MAKPDFFDDVKLITGNVTSPADFAPGWQRHLCKSADEDTVTFELSGDYCDNPVKLASLQEKLERHFAEYGLTLTERQELQDVNGTDAFRLTYRVEAAEPAMAKADEDETELEGDADSISDEDMDAADLSPEEKAAISDGHITKADRAILSRAKNAPRHTVSVKLESALETLPVQRSAAVDAGYNLST